MWSKILKFFPHFIIQVGCKILWFDVEKKLKYFLLFALEMAVFSVILAEKGLGR